MDTATHSRLIDAEHVLEQLVPNLRTTENNWGGFDIADPTIDIRLRKTVRVTQDDTVIAIHVLDGYALEAEIKISGSLPAATIAHIIASLLP